MTKNKLSTDKQIEFVRDISLQVGSISKVLENIELSIEKALKENYFDDDIYDSLRVFADNTMHLQFDIKGAIGDSGLSTYKTTDELHDEEIDKLVEKQHNDSLRDLSNKF